MKYLTLLLLAFSLTSCAGITAGTILPFVPIVTHWYPRHGVDPVPASHSSDSSSSNVQPSADYGYTPGRGGYYPGRDRDQSNNNHEGGNGRYKVDYDRGTKHGDHGRYRDSH